MLVKLIQYWDVILGRQAEFDKFLIDEYIPEINKSGLVKIAETWNVLVGEGPYFGMEGIADSIDNIQSLILSDGYKLIKGRLFHYVVNYYSKMLGPREEIFPSPKETEEGFKYTQNFDLNPPDYYEFLRFAQEQYLPCLEGMGMTLAGVWYVNIGPTPHRIFEWYSKKLETIAKLFDSADFQKLRVKFVSMTSDYGCRILVPSGHIRAA
jgi:hypothetical protein